MEKFHGKYRISSARLRNWDYTSCGMYFVTLCTKGRGHHFGNISKPETGKEHFRMKLSEIGKIVESEWLRTPEVRPDMNLSLGEFQVMPNHFHAILIIGENEFNTKELIHETNNNSIDPGRDAMFASLIKLDSDPAESESQSIDKSKNKSRNDSEEHTISELEIQMILGTNSKGKNKFAPQSKNLGSVMRGFKLSVTSILKNQNIYFNWQPRFYDHIIRNHDEYLRIANYIRNNPDNWGNDRLR